jgi:hypothetical protein
MTPMSAATAWQLRLGAALIFIGLFVVVPVWLRSLTPGRASRLQVGVSAELR